MKQIRIPALLLAAVLQLLPMCRTVCSSPAFTSTFAIIFRWTLGATAAFGAFDSVSGGSQVYFDGPGAAVGTVGVPFTYYITLGGTVGTDGGSVVAGAPLPAGFTNSTVSHLTSPVSEWGVISGTPSSTMTNVLINLAASNPYYNTGIPITGSLYLTVYPASDPVVISTQPTNVIATHGQTVSFTVAATGTGPLSYQWFKSDTNIWNHIQSATNASYSFVASNVIVTNGSPVKTNYNYNSGNYLVRIAGAAGMLSSAFANLAVNTTSLSITAPPTNLTVNVGQPATFYVSATSSGSISYQWYKNSTKINGATGNSFNIARVVGTNAGNYTVAVTNTAQGITNGGSLGLVSAMATLTVTTNAAVAPSISSQPTNQTVTAGQPATFVIAASGTGPLSYQWLRGGSIFFVYATNSTWSLANTRAADAGIYSVVVSNSAGGITSSNAQLTVTVPPAPVLSLPALDGNKFLFTFTPVVGLTNTVLTNSSVTGAGWGVLTNIPPPATDASITVTDTITGSLNFYRASIAP